MKKQEHTFCFISGLPRAGSTLLANILMQNPRFHATHTSGIADVMFGVRNNWDKLIEFRAHPDNKGKKRVLEGILKNFYAPIDRPVIFDKSRSWLSFLEMAEEILGYKPKVLVPVRDIREILASFEKLWRENSKTTQISQEEAHYFDFQSVEGRCATWMLPGEPVGIAYNRVKDAVVRGHKEQMYFVEFEKFTNDPKKEMKYIYNFLGEKYFEHDFENVEQVTQEDDTVHGFKDLHLVRKKVAPIAPRWPDILGHAAEPYAELDFWKKL